MYILEPGTKNYHGVAKYDLATTAGKPGVFEEGSLADAGQV